MLEANLGMEGYRFEKEDEAETGNENPKIRQVTVELTEEGLQEQLFFAFADARLPILEMRKDEKSLEDVFLSLTQETGGDA